MLSYNNGKIYKLVNSFDDQIYIGSTCSSLTKRKSNHRTRARKYPDRKAYKHLNRIGWENVRIILIEEVIAYNKNQLRMREDFYINLMKPSLNSCSAIDTCSHGRQQSSCKDCGGVGICQHNKRKNTCKECNPTHICFECDKNFSSEISLTRHCQSLKHKQNCKQLFFDCFGEILEDSDIPIY